MSFPSKEVRQNCWSHRDKYWQCLDEGKSQEECREFRKQYEKFCPSQWVSTVQDDVLNDIPRKAKTCV